MSSDMARIRRWRRRGFYSERTLVRQLQDKGFSAVRVPVSNPSMSPLPDVIGHRNSHVYAFEVKNARKYAYYPKDQIEKLFRFLEDFIPIPRPFKHAVLAAHLGKKWIFRQVPWKTRDKLADKERVMKGDRGNWRP